MLLVRNLEKDELEVYIDTIIKSMYDNFISNDKNKVKTKINDLNEIIGIVINEYPHIREYINYRCIIISNKTFQSIFDRDFSLYFPSEKVSIDFRYEDEHLLSDLFDEDTLIHVLYGLQFEEDLNSVLNFIKDLPILKEKYKNELTINNRIPRKCIALITDFMEDVKSGKYDGYLEVPEDYIIDDEDYLDDFTYFENRHRENRNKAPSDEVFKY